VDGSEKVQGVAHGHSTVPWRTRDTKHEKHLKEQDRIERTVNFEQERL
jgi:hypothetical protein